MCHVTINTRWYVKEKKSVVLIFNNNDKKLKIWAQVARVYGTYVDNKLLKYCHQKVGRSYYFPYIRSYRLLFDQNQLRKIY